MGTVQCVELECFNECAWDKLFPDLELWIQGSSYEILHEGGKTFVEPEVSPPLHGDEVAEPLVRSFVANYNRHPLLR